jgi:hypothetical protein
VSSWGARGPRPSKTADIFRDSDSRVIRTISDLTHHAGCSLLSKMLPEVQVIADRPFDVRGNHPGANLQEPVTIRAGFQVRVSILCFW